MTDARRTKMLRELLMRPADIAETCSPFIHQPLRLSLRCTECGQAHEYEVSGATCFLEDGQERPAGWDGVTLDQIICCKSCGALDRYELSETARLRLLTEAVASAVSKAPGDARVVFGTPLLGDGTLVARPSQAIEHLRGIATANPSSCAAWRRLGNICGHYNLREEAEEAWRKAIDVEDLQVEVEAPTRLCLALLNQRPTDALDYCIMALLRLPKAHASDEIRATVSTKMVAVLKQFAFHISPPISLVMAWPDHSLGDQPNLQVSSIDLRKVPDWGLLAKLLGSGVPLAIDFSHDLPDEDPTLLQVMLSDPAHIAALRPVSATSAPGLTPPHARPPARRAATSPQDKRHQRKAAKAREKARRHKRKRGGKGKGKGKGKRQ